MPGDEDPAGLVDPDLLDRRVVKVALQRAQAGHRVEDRTDRRARVRQRRQGAGEAALVVMRDDFLDEQPGRRRVCDRVEPSPADQLADLILDDADRVHVAPVFRAGTDVREAGPSLLGRADRAYPSLFLLWTTEVTRSVLGVRVLQRPSFDDVHDVGGDELAGTPSRLDFDQDPGRDELLHVLRGCAMGDVEQVASAVDGQGWYTEKLVDEDAKQP